MTRATPHAHNAGIRLDVQMFMQRVAEACLPTNVCVTWTHGPRRGCLVCYVAYTQCSRCCCCCRYGCCVAKIINDAPRTCIKNKAQKNADSQRLRLPIKAEHKAELTNRTPASGMKPRPGGAGPIECCRCCPLSLLLLLLLLAFYVCWHNAAAGKTNNDSDSAINVSCTGCQLGQTKQQSPPISSDPRCAYSSLVYFCMFMALFALLFMGVHFKCHTYVCVCDRDCPWRHPYRWHSDTGARLTVAVILSVHQKRLFDI